MVRRFYTSRDIWVSKDASHEPARNRLRWSETMEINAENRGGPENVFSSDQTKIVHSGRLPDRPKFLLELETQCAKSCPMRVPTPS